MNVIDLFSSCGGFSCGFQQTRYKTVLAIKKDGNAAEIFSFNHPNANLQPHCYEAHQTTDRKV